MFLCKSKFVSDLTLNGFNQILPILNLSGDYHSHNYTVKEYSVIYRKIL